MANKVEQLLTQSLYDCLQKERFVTLATIDHETGGPNLSAISWVFSPDAQHVHLAVDNRSRIVENVKKNPLVVINLFANETTYAISGEANLKIEKLDGLPLKLALIEVAIKEVRDVMFYGSKLSVEPSYEKTYDAEAAAKLDRQVMDAIKKA
jgi:hypothetical protein